MSLSVYLSLSSGSPENFFKPLKVHSKNLAVVDGEGGDPPPFTTNYILRRPFCKSCQPLFLLQRTSLENLSSKGLLQILSSVPAFFFHKRNVVPDEQVIVRPHRASEGVCALVCPLDVSVADLCYCHQCQSNQHHCRDHHHLLHVGNQLLPVSWINAPRQVCLNTQYPDVNLVNSFTIIRDWQ